MHAFCFLVQQIPHYSVPRADFHWGDDSRGSRTQAKLITFFFFLAMPTVCGNSWARDLTCSTVVTSATAVTTLDP